MSNQFICATAFFIQIPIKRQQLKYSHDSSRTSICHPLVSAVLSTTGSDKSDGEKQLTSSGIGLARSTPSA